MIMISLTAYVLASTKKPWSKHILLIGACLFALIGDLFLLSTDAQSFLLGLAFFLLMHLCYIYLFFRQKAIGIHKHITKIIAVTTLIMIANILLWNRTGDLQIPVLIYSIVIGGTLMTALMRWKTKGYYQVILGAILFIISDALIGVQEFFYRFDHLSFFIMLTYGAAQFLILDGYLKGRG